MLHHCQRITWYRKITKYAAQRGNRAAGHKFTMSESKLRLWISGHSYFHIRWPQRVLQAQTKEYDVDAAVLHFSKGTHPKRMPCHTKGNARKDNRDCQITRNNKFYSSVRMAWQIHARWRAVTQELNIHLLKDSNWFWREISKLPVMPYSLREEIQLSFED